MTDSDRSTSSRPAGLAPTSQKWDAARDWPAPGLDYGPRCGELLARFDPVSSSWKTPQTCFTAITGESSESFSAIWPRSGMVSSGACYAVTTLECGKSASDSLLWPTILGGSEKSHTNGRSCLPASARHLLEEVNLSPSEVESLMGLPIGWTLANESRFVQTPSSRTSLSGSLTTSRPLNRDE